MYLVYSTLSGGMSCRNPSLIIQTGPARESLMKDATSSVFTCGEQMDLVNRQLSIMVPCMPGNGSLQWHVPDEVNLQSGTDNTNRPLSTLRSSSSMDTRQATTSPKPSSTTMTSTSSPSLTPMVSSQVALLYKLCC
jgi:hypothetical protein